MKLKVKTDARVRCTLRSIREQLPPGVYRCVVNPAWYVVCDGRSVVGFNGDVMTSLDDHLAEFEALPAGTRITVEFTA